MIQIIEGIVLKNIDYQEKSKILQVFSKEHGLIGIYLKGANNYKSNSYSIASPISHASFSVSYKEGLSSCYTGEIINAFTSLKLDFEKNIYIFHLFELILKNLEQHNPNEYLYNLLIKTLLLIDKTDNKKEIILSTIFFELKLLYFLGVSPVLSNCVECGKTDNITNFDINRGGFVCRNCLDIKSRQFSFDTLQNLYKLFYSEFDNINFEIDDNVLKELRILINEYYMYHLGIKTNCSRYFS